MNGLHVLAVPDRPTPQLVVVADGGGPPHHVDLAQDFSMRVGAVRTCVGRFDDGTHVPCPTAQPVSRHRQCGPCSGLENQDCIFEPRCGKDPSSCLCIASFKGIPHVVYLAFHGTLPKVGMTQARRVEARLREQGADAWFIVQPCPDRAAARNTEMAVSYLYGIPEHRSHRETLPQLARPVPWDRIAARADQFRLRLEGAHDVERGLHRIADHALAQPLNAVPHRVPTAGAHEGRWVGIKGQHLVYREASRAGRLHVGEPPLAAIKRGDLVGRRVAFAAHAHPI